MANRRELAQARRNLQRAQLTLDLIETLPRRVGETLTWDNGVVWHRVGDNAWVAEIEGEIPEWSRAYPSPSSHVATRANQWLPRSLRG